LLRRRRAVERSSRRQRQRRPNRDRRDRRRYEGLPHGRPSALLGRHVSTARRKRRPKALEALAQGRALAETRARPGGPGGDEGEKLQPQGAILQPQTAPRPQEGDHRRRRRDAAHHLPYAQGRNLLPRPRTRLPSASKPGARGPKPRQPNPLPRLRRRNQKGRMTTTFQERVNAQLIDAGSGAHLWAEQFDTPRADLLQTQDAIIAHLAHAIDLQLIYAEGARVKRTPAANRDAEDLALQCDAGHWK